MMRADRRGDPAVTVRAPLERRRRRREEVHEAIRRATPLLLEDTAFKDLTVDEIASAAGLSRTAFYFYFRDKYDLLTAAVEDVGEDFYREADRWWHGEGEPRELVRAALGGIASVYEQHAGLIRVMTEVSTYEKELADFWRSLVQRFIDATTEHLRRERQAGRVPGLDPVAAAESLVWMAERSFYIYVARGERAAGELVESLTDLWVAALYTQGSKRAVTQPAGDGR